MTDEPTSKLTPAPSRGPGSAIAGFTYPARALRLLRKTPHLRRYVILPILVNVVLGIVLYSGLLYVGWEQIDSVVTSLPTWAIAFAWLLRILLTIVLFLLIGFLFLQFGVLLGSPWYGKLSEELEKLKTGQPAVVPANSVLGPIYEVWRAILYEVKKLLVWLLVFAGLLLFNLVPGFGTAIATVGGLLLASTIASLDFLDPALERRRFQFRHKLKLVLDSWPAGATFGLVCFGLASIPFVNLLAIPLCVAGGTIFFCDRILPKL